jgi:hypothetical protein
VNHFVNSVKKRNSLKQFLKKIRYSRAKSSGGKSAKQSDNYKKTDENKRPVNKRYHPHRYAAAQYSVNDLFRWLRQFCEQKRYQP